MVFTWLFVMPVGLLVCWIADLIHDRKTDEARRNLQRRDGMNRVDQAAAALTRNDPWVELDQAWCADLGIDFVRTAPSSTPMRPFDPAPHTYPRRPARHGSHNRLHRGF